MAAIEPFGACEDIFLLHISARDLQVDAKTTGEGLCPLLRVARHRWHICEAEDCIVGGDKYSQSRGDVML